MSKAINAVESKITVIIVTDLTKKKCIPCSEGMPPLSKKEVHRLLKEVPGWSLNGDNWLIREFKFDDFAKTIRFVNEVARIAEEEDHHPNIYVYSWNHLRLEFYTHIINGLSENDFIMAAKINRLKHA